MVKIELHVNHVKHVKHVKLCVACSIAALFGPRACVVSLPYVAAG
jgi:hypothetical protein